MSRYGHRILEFALLLVHSVYSGRWRAIRIRGPWRYVEFLWASTNDGPLERSQRSVSAIFMELRLGFDVTGDVSRWDLIHFARLSGCEDLIEEAMLPAEEYQRRVESAGGSYPLEGLRRTWQQR